MKIQSSAKSAGMLMPRKLIIPSFIIFCISAFTSCKKDAVSVRQEDIVAEEQEEVVSSMQSSNELAAPATTFGMLISGNTSIDDEAKVGENLGVKYVRYAIMLTEFNGVDKGYEKWVDAGYKIILNLNWGKVATSTGKKNAVPFPTNMEEYRSKLEKVLDKYQPEIAVIENEPTTDVFHSGPIENYITELKTAVEVCNARGIAVTDGGLHMSWVEQIKSGWGKSSGNGLETKKLIDAYKTINLTYVNTHVKSSGNTYSGKLEGDADYLRTETGKPVMCNEYNQEGSSTNLMTGQVGGFKNAGFKYVIARSGNSGEKMGALNNGTSLTSLGIAYRDAIK